MVPCFDLVRLICARSWCPLSPIARSPHCWLQS